MSQISNETSKNPPFFGKNDWILDPSKIVQRSPINRLPIIAEGRSQEAANADTNTTTTTITIEKHVKFAPYIICHSHINGQCYVHKMEPFELSRARSTHNDFLKLMRENELLRDDAFILEHKNDRLKETIKRKNEQINRLKAANGALLLYPIIVILMATYYILRYSQTF